jgi:hypothetical protein
MRLFMAATASVLTAISLSGCALLQALTFQQHPASHVPAGKVDVWLVRRASDKEIQASDPGGEHRKILDENANWCYESLPKEKILIAPLAGAALTAVAGVLIGAVGNEIAGYVDKQTKTFTSTFGNAVNHVMLFGKDEKKQLRLEFDCIVVRQATKEKSAGFDFAALVVPSKGTTPEGYTLVPVFYRMSRSSARTGLTGDVDVTVGITISAVMSEGTGRKFATLADRTIVMSAISLPQRGKDGKFPDLGEERRASTQGEERLGTTNASAWFPLTSDSDSAACEKDGACRGIMPVSVIVKVTEVGTGSPEYGLASKEAGDLSKTISDGIGKIITSVTSKK